MLLKEGFIDAVSDKIGATAALILAALFGGASLYVPDKPSIDHPIGRAIGLDAMEILCAVWGGQTIELPRLDGFDRMRRISAVSTLLSLGISPHHIAKCLGITYQQVKNYRTQAEELLLLPTVLHKRADAVQQIPLLLRFRSAPGGLIERGE